VFVAASNGETFAGPDIIVAAEKTGLTYGHLGIFHRMAAFNSEFGAVFSVANMVRPGRFEMAQIKTLKSPGLTLFMVLPNAKPALDAWDMMLPTAQRLAELLGGIVLDEERNAMSRQRIQHIRDELRAYDRAREKNTIKRSW
jgi:cell division protein ZipA